MNNKLINLKIEGVEFKAKVLKSRYLEIAPKCKAYEEVTIRFERGVEFSNPQTHVDYFFGAPDDLIISIGDFLPCEVGNKFYCSNWRREFKVIGIENSIITLKTNPITWEDTII